MAFFDCAVNNSYILYKQNCEIHHVRRVYGSRKWFRVNVIGCILSNSHRKRPRRPRNQDSNSDSLCEVVKVSTIGLSRGRCYHCVKEERAKVRHTSFGCSHCKVRLCKTVCFAEFH